LTTAVHEAGHLLVAAHFGVPSRSVGVALFYLQPAGYVDVTEAWLAPRRARIAIALGGILAQTVPLVVFYVLWRLTGGPIWGAYCGFSVALMLFNLIPFVRLDGYWCLSHWLNEPNLRQRALLQVAHVLAPRTHAPQWAGVRGYLAALFGAVSLLVGAGLYASALFGLRSILPIHLPIFVPLLALGALGATQVVALLKQ
jgi:putative peptide zinc metalloprotease protein